MAPVTAYTCAPHTAGRLLDPVLPYATRILQRHVRAVITLVQDSMHTAPRQPTGVSLRRGPFPEFLMDIANSNNTSHLIHNLDVITDDALTAAVDAVHAPCTLVSQCCDALRWVATEGTM